MRKQSELFFSLLLLPIDFCAILGAFIVAYAIRVKVDVRPVAHPYGLIFFLKIFLLIIPVWILLFAFVGLYNQSSLRGRFQELGRIFVAVSAGVMFMIMVDFVSKTPLFPSKAVPVYAYGISLVTVTAGRFIVRALQRSLFSKGIGVYRSILVGSGPLAQQLAISLAATATSGYTIIGVIDAAQGAASRMSPFPVDESLDTALKRLHGQPVDEIIQADSSLSPDAIFELVEYAANHQITYRFIPNQFGIFATHSELGTLAGMPMVAMKRTPLDGWGRIVKRGFDLVAAAVGLIVLSPLFLVIAIIIKISDPGRVFYRHKRLSRTGTPMYVYKFRSMYERYSTGGAFSGKTDAEVFAELDRPELIEEFKREQKVKDDPRVTPIGRWLRHTSLDELPQLINILRGDISLVGPRPIVEAELANYGSNRSALLALKPGLTGLWQVSGRNDVSYDERVKLDIYYIENWTLWLDIKIILRTIVIVFGRRGAY
ncbi:MAG TPA: sugar transferase [Candidatus Saccharimonadales bacterium]|nr:sugar transferase [Candidatus Saccharimonadales bacterium]